MGVAGVLRAAEEKGVEAALAEGVEVIAEEKEGVEWEEGV